MVSDTFNEAPPAPRTGDPRMGADSERHREMVVQPGENLNVVPVHVLWPASR